MSLKISSLAFDEYDHGGDACVYVLCYNGETDFLTCVEAHLAIQEMLNVACGGGAGYGDVDPGLFAVHCDRYYRECIPHDENGYDH